MLSFKIKVGLLLSLSYCIYGMEKLPQGHQHWIFSNQSPQSVIIWQPTVFSAGARGWEREKLNPFEDTKDMMMMVGAVPTYLLTMSGEYSIYVQNHNLYLVKESLDASVTHPSVKIPYEEAMDLMVLINRDGSVSITDRRRPFHPAYLNIIKPTIIDILRFEFGASDIKNFEFRNPYDWSVLTEESLKAIIKFVDQASPVNIHEVSITVKQPEISVRMRLDIIKNKAKVELKKRESVASTRDK